VSLLTATLKRLFTNSVTTGLWLSVLLWLHPADVAPIPVRFVESTVHGFLVLSTIDGTMIASGDLRQTASSKGIEDRTLFQFKDGSVSEETVVFTQQKVFSMQSYQSVQRGPTFAKDEEILLERPSGKYRVKTKDHKDGKEKTIDGTLDLPSDVYNGMIFTVAKNLPGATSKTIHVVAFTPEPRIIQLTIAPVGEKKVTVGGDTKSATQYVLHPQLGAWLKLFSNLTGRTPPDEHVWILADPIPVFVKFEGPLYISGPVWRIELASPR